jgi:hypothetical protein
VYLASMLATMKGMTMSCTTQLQASRTLLAKVLVSKGLLDVVLLSMVPKQVLQLVQQRLVAVDADWDHTTTFPLTCIRRLL